jgi:hypothetical protein
VDDVPSKGACGDQVEWNSTKSRAIPSSYGYIFSLENTLARNQSVSLPIPCNNACRSLLLTDICVHEQLGLKVVALNSLLD